MPPDVINYQVLRAVISALRGKTLTSENGNRVLAGETDGAIFREMHRRETHREKMLPCDANGVPWRE